jgi:single-stranded-DNA-specific exonuclease
MRLKSWVYKTSTNEESILDLSRQLNIQPILAKLLVDRGIQSYDEAKSFFRPNLADLHNPFLMAGMKEAVERINLARKNKERIMVYGDYDVDGTTSVSLMYSYLVKDYDHVCYYIPDRYNEGYGVSFLGIDTAEKENCRLIISLDCGIKAIDKVAYAKEKGIDFIICDHHRPGADLPDAVAVLDPKRTDCHYPYKELSGCGVGFKLIQALQADAGNPFDELEEYLDLVAVSIGADIVHITGENRVLAYYGLKRLNACPRPGFKAFMELNEGREMSIGDVVFMIAPRINAAGRIEHACKAVELLTEANADQARSFAEKINSYNDYRKELDRSITEEALELISELGEENRKSTVVFSPEWHKGVIGIVASRLIETYYRPTLVFTESKGKLTASARSVKGFDVYNALEACGDLIEQFGGHMYAAGLTIKKENYEAFKAKFEQVVTEQITDDMLTEKIEIDAVIDLNAINDRFYNILKQFEPHGPENLHPVFCTKNVIDNGWTKCVGEEDRHLKLGLRPVESNLPYMSGIGFNMGQYYPELSQRAPFDVCYALEENVWKNKVNLQLRVKDIKIHH